MRQNLPDIAQYKAEYAQWVEPEHLSDIDQIITIKLPFNKNLFGCIFT